VADNWQGIAVRSLTERSIHFHLNVLFLFANDASPTNQDLFDFPSFCVVDDFQIIKEYHKNISHVVHVTVLVYLKRPLSSLSPKIFPISHSIWTRIPRSATPPCVRFKVDLQYLGRRRLMWKPFASLSCAQLPQAFRQKLKSAEIALARRSKQG
jgi:hypothetical protein